MSGCGVPCSCAWVRLSPVCSLDLSTCRLVANALVALPHLASCWICCRFPSLRSLNLSTCRLAADGQLQGLGALQLTSLSLARCEALTCAGLQHVGMLPTLAELDLEGCCRVSAFLASSGKNSKAFWEEVLLRELHKGTARLLLCLSLKV